MLSWYTISAQDRKELLNQRGSEFT